MKKDVTIAIAVGFLLGALTAIVAVNLPSIMKREAFPQIAQITPVLSPSQLAKSQVELVVNQPEDGTIVSSKKIDVSGKTNANNILVLETDLDIDAKESSSDGSFSFPVSLTESGNSIHITAYNENAQSETKTITVFYTSEKL